MNEYHKIQTVFKRDPETRFKTLLEDDYSLPELEYLKDNEWVFTEKVDGTNIRVMYCAADNYIHFGGKTDRAQIPATLVERLREKFGPISMSNAIKEIFNETDICLYGEGYGEKIQKGGGNYKPTQDFVLFDVKIGDWWLQRKDVEDVANKLEIDIVPILGKGTLIEMVECAKVGIASTWGGFQAEGIVARPSTELKTRSGHRIITKIKCKDFLTR